MATTNVLKGGKGEHWLNGVKVAEYDLHSPEFKAKVASTKFKAWPQTLRAPFEALRTVTPKAPKFVLRRLDTHGEGK